LRAVRRVLRAVRLALRAVRRALRAVRLAILWDTRPGPGHKTFLPPVAASKNAEKTS